MFQSQLAVNAWSSNCFFLAYFSKKLMSKRVKIFFGTFWYGLSKLQHAVSPGDEVSALTSSFASLLVMVDYTYKYNIKGFFILSSQTWEMESREKYIIEFFILNHLLKLWNSKISKFILKTRLEIQKIIVHKIDWFYGSLIILGIYI